MPDFDRELALTGTSIPNLQNWQNLIAKYQDQFMQGIEQGQQNVQQQQENRQKFMGQILEQYMEDYQPVIEGRVATPGQLLQAQMMGIMPEKIEWEKRPEEPGIPKLVTVDESLSKLIKSQSGADVSVGTQLTTGGISQLLKTPKPVVPPGAKLTEFQRKEQVKAKARQRQAVIKMEISFNKVGNLMTRLMSQKKASLAEGGILTGAGAIKGSMKKIASRLKIPGFSLTSAYEGQMFETALALNSILTGQNRVIRGVVNRITRTLPTIYDPEEFAIDKIAQSVKNSFGLLKAMQNSGIDRNFISKFSNKELDDPNSSINIMIERLIPEPLTQEEALKVEPIIQQIINVQPARKFKVGGKLMIDDEGNKAMVYPDGSYREVR